MLCQCSPDSAECMRDGAAADRYFGDADKAVDLTTYSQGEDCAVSEEGQASACSEAGECDARVYLAWLGTDSQGEPLTSAGVISMITLRFGRLLLHAYSCCARFRLRHLQVPIILSKGDDGSDQEEHQQVDLWLTDAASI